MDNDQLAIYCVADCKDGAMQRILISPNDSIAICPNCRRRYGVSTRVLEQVETERLEDGRQRYRMVVRDQYGGRRLRTIEAHRGLNLRPDALVTFVKRGTVLIGISDHSRELWFTVPPAPSPLRKAAKFIDFMSAVILLCVALQLMRFVPAFEAYLNSAGANVILLIAIPALLLLGPWAANRFGERVGRRQEAQEPKSSVPPPLKLPDID